MAKRVRKNISIEEARGIFCYMGPTLPDGQLKQSALLRGTKSAVLTRLQPVLEKYPQVKELLVPMT